MNYENSIIISYLCLYIQVINKWSKRNMAICQLFIVSTPKHHSFVMAQDFPQSNTFKNKLKKHHHHHHHQNLHLEHKEFLLDKTL